MKPTTDIDQLKNQIDSSLGKTPPQAIDVEEVVLGALILEERAVLENKINPEWFYKESNKTIAKEILSINKSGKKIDLVTVISTLKDKGIIDELGGIKYILDLTKRVASAAHIGQHLRILHDKYTRREIIKMSYEVNAMAYDESNDVEDIVSRLHDNALGVMDYHEEKIVTFEHALNDLVKNIVANEKSRELVGIPTGFPVLNRHTGGWQPTDFIVIAGESSQGKTSLALKFSLEAGLAGIPGAVYSLEMSTLQLTARYVSMYSKVNSKKILFDVLNPFEMQLIGDSVSRLSSVPIFIDDDVTTSIDSLILSIRRLHLKYGIRYAIVDYIQNVSEIKGKTEEQSLATISKSLKNLAKELNITIFGLSQLGRNKDRPIPTMARLRGSGQIEETADVVIAVFRPEYYGIKFPEPYSDVPTEGAGMIMILKGRNVGTGSFFASFDAKTTSWYENSSENNNMGRSEDAF